MVKGATDGPFVIRMSKAQLRLVCRAMLGRIEPDDHTEAMRLLGTITEELLGEAEPSAEEKAPEELSPEPEPEADPRRCTGCGAFRAKRSKIRWPLPDLCPACAAAAEPGKEEPWRAEQPIAVELPGATAVLHGATEVREADGIHMVVELSPSEALAKYGKEGFDGAVFVQEDAPGGPRVLTSPNPYSRKRPLPRGGANNWREKRAAQEAKGKQS